MSGIPYVRFKGPSTSSRKFGPKTPDHPSVGEFCAACGRMFHAGDFTALVPLGPGDDPEAQDKARSGRFYNAVGLEVHWACATGETNATGPDGPVVVVN